MTPLPLDSAAGELVQLLWLVLPVLVLLQVVPELPLLPGVAPRVPSTDKKQKKITCDISPIIFAQLIFKNLILINILNIPTSPASTFTYKNELQLPKN